MARPKHVTASGTADHGKPLAVPLAVAAQMLGVPTTKIKNIGVEPYIAMDGTPKYSLRELAKALGLPVGQANPGPEQVTGTGRVLNSTRPRPNAGAAVVHCRRYFRTCLM